MKDRLKDWLHQDAPFRLTGVHGTARLRYVKERTTLITHRLGAVADRFEQHRPQEQGQGVRKTFADAGWEKVGTCTFVRIGVSESLNKRTKVRQLGTCNRLIRRHIPLPMQTIGGQPATLNGHPPFEICKMAAPLRHHIFGIDTDRTILLVQAWQWRTASAEATRPQNPTHRRINLRSRSCINPRSKRIEVGTFIRPATAPQNATKFPKATREEGNDSIEMTEPRAAVKDPKWLVPKPGPESTPKSCKTQGGDAPPQGVCSFPAGSGAFPCTSSHWQGWALSL